MAELLREIIRFFEKVDHRIILAFLGMIIALLGMIAVVYVFIGSAH